jgi:lipoprotein-anchoring transpeptidase ErfK/SrfK
MRIKRVGWRTATAVLFAAPLALSACTHGHNAASAGSKAGTSAKHVVIGITPATGAANQPVSTEIGTAITDGALSSVSLTDASGNAVGGNMRADNTSWVPAEPLQYKTAYHAVVTATGPDGKRKTQSSDFTTMADPGSNRITSSLYIQDGSVYGVGMPVAIQFDNPIPDSAKAAVEKRLFVQSDPPQVGVWHWFGDNQVLYRPQEYWKTGTKITVRAALGGVPVGDRFLDTDRSGTATIGDKVSFQIDNASKSMKVYQNDQLTKTFPVSLGKASTPSSSGNLVIMSHDRNTIFNVPGEYVVPIDFAERITWDGQYIHAAPWSVGDQGVDNVSHGCVNLSEDNASYVFDVSHIGDPVTVSGTEVHVDPGDGWTVWDLNWVDYVKGSALPHPDLPQQAGGAGNNAGQTAGNGPAAPHVN